MLKEFHGLVEVQVEVNVPGFLFDVKAILPSLPLSLYNISFGLLVIVCFAHYDVTGICIFEADFFELFVASLFQLFF